MVRERGPWLKSACSVFWCQPSPEDFVKLTNPLRSSWCCLAQLAITAQKMTGPSEDGDWIHTSSHPIKGNISRSVFRWIKGTVFGRGPSAHPSVGHLSSCCSLCAEGAQTHTQPHALMSASEHLHAGRWGQMHIVFVKRWSLWRKNWNSDCKFISDGKIGLRSTKLFSCGGGKFSSVIYLNAYMGLVYWEFYLGCWLGQDRLPLGEEPFLCFHPLGVLGSSHHGDCQTSCFHFLVVGVGDPKRWSDSLHFKKFVRDYDKTQQTSLL